MTRGDISQLPLEVGSDAIEVAAALGQQAIDPGLGVRREIALPDENRNAIIQRIQAADAWLTLLEDNGCYVPQPRLTQECRQFSANDRGHSRRNEQDFTAAKEG